MDSYITTILDLFRLLTLANESDQITKKEWQLPWDANERPNALGTLRFFGSIKSAIVAIAGEKIVDHWAETNEVDINLANRMKEEVLILPQIVP